MTPQLIANGAAVISILLVLLAAPLVLGTYVVVQRTGVMTQLIWLGGILVLLVGGVVAGAAGLLALG